MKKIPLTQGKFALVDDADFDWLNQWKWTYQKGYASRTEYLGGGRKSPKRKHISMHRLISGAPDGVSVDHCDMDGLNNQRQNLRHATATQNAMNRKSHKGSSSKYKGVSWCKKYGKYRAHIRISKKLMAIGYFANEDDAACAYNHAAIKNFGEFARINQIGDAGANKTAA